MPLAIIQGPAGTAKTFYALAAGLEQVLETEERPYRKILVCRPNAQFDADIGFLPGSEQEKISPLMRPIVDNLEILLDLAVQELLRERLAALAPDVQFMGEEQDNTGLDWSRPCWVLDPVDGTTNLIHNFRHSAVSLALSEAGQIIFGVVYNPYSGECFTARRGRAPSAMAAPSV